MSDIDRTIALWQAQRPRVTAFEAWQALGHGPCAAVTWRDVRDYMIEWSGRDHISGHV